MAGKIIDLAQVGKDTKCANKDCLNIIPFGTFGFVNSETGEALCLDCGAARGFTTKARVKMLLATKELKQTIKLLKAEEKTRLDAIAMLDQKIDLTRLGERDVEIENKIVALTELTSKYFREGIGTAEEKAMRDAVMKVIEELRELQLEIRDRVENGLYGYENKPKEKQQVAVTQ